MNNSQIGLLVCFAIELVPLAAGIAIGLWLQRRINRLGWPAALVPGWAKKWMEANLWK